jgi:hypothetical protein
MTRSILVTFGWFGATASVYLTLVILELHWNVFNWRPNLDPEALCLLLVLFSALIAIRLLAQVTRDHLSQWVSLLLCSSLFALAVYVLPPEPLTQGMFARQQPSPLWYRGVRFVVLVMPLSFWVYGLLQRRKLASQHDAARSGGPVSPLENFTPN